MHIPAVSVFEEEAVSAEERKGLMELLKSFLSSRVTQILMRFFYTFLIGKLGYDQAKAQSLTDDVSTLVVAVILFLLDMTIHAYREWRQKQKIEVKP